MFVPDIKPRKILIVTDAWHPQINGVVRTLETTARELQRQGHDVKIVGPDVTRWSTFAAPSYPSIKLEFFGRERIRRIVDESSTTRNFMVHSFTSHRLRRLDL